MFNRRYVVLIAEHVKNEMKTWKQYLKWEIQGYVKNEAYNVLWRRHFGGFEHTNSMKLIFGNDFAKYATLLKLVTWVMQEGLEKWSICEPKKM
jgi:hypothetical protein